MIRRSLLDDEMYIFYDIEEDKIFDFIAGVWQKFTGVVSMENMLPVPAVSTDSKEFKDRIKLIIVKDMNYFEQPDEIKSRLISKSIVAIPLVFDALSKEMRFIPDYEDMYPLDRLF